ncbi:hypothetical protein PFISCL1PPCAC_8543, partial [Pristionchus fissidentatus]
VPECEKTRSDVIRVQNPRDLAQIQLGRVKFRAYDLEFVQSEVGEGGKLVVHLFRRIRLNLQCHVRARVVLVQRVDHSSDQFTVLQMDVALQRDARQL